MAVSRKNIRIAVNGFGRIGRSALRALFERPDIGKQVTVVAVNDVMDAETLAHLLTYDTVFHRSSASIMADHGFLHMNGTSIPVLSEKDPSALPWKKMDVHVVLECTGRFTTKEQAEAHLSAGAKRVIVSAPAKGGVPTFLLGVNTDGKAEARPPIINNASCTTNSVGPVTAVIESAFGIQKAAVTTVHSVTAEQNLVDGPPPARHKDLRRARSALVNIVPTTTGAALATTEAMPTLRARFDGMAIRVPTIDVSLSDFTFVLKKQTTAARVNAVFLRAVKSARYRGILGVSAAPLVSSDFIGSPYSAVVDLEYTKVIDGDLLKVLAWYDNEWGYANRLIEMAVRVGRALA